MTDHPNINALWGSLLVEELVRSGVTHFVISPGSRSAPIVAAVARNEQARARVAVDERSAAYLALGISRAGHTTAVITTSGTAVANLLPAVVEASADHVPLLLVTADRPPELLESGANQAIRQRGIFGDQVRWAFDLPCPDDRISVRMLLTTVDQAVARAHGPDPGPVHLNAPFREPLAPSEAPWDRSCMSGTEAWQVSDRPFTAMGSEFPASPSAAPSTSAPTLSPTSALASASASASAGAARRRLAGIRSGIVVAGSLPDDEHTRRAVPHLAARLGWPLVADVRSQLRLGLPSEWHIPHLPRILQAKATPWQPDAVLQLGGRLTSRRLQRLVEEGPAREHIVVDPSSERLDPGHRVRMRIQAGAAEFCASILPLLTETADRPSSSAAASARSSTPLPELRRINSLIEDAIERAIDETSRLTEPFVARWLTRHLPPDHALFLSSSLPIRDVDAYGAIDGPPVSIAANRGASGIDGVLASAVGYAIGRDRPVTVLIGDLAFLHDLNSLLLLGRTPHPVVVVLLNNRGGGIFSFLPIASHREIFSPWFDTPHDVNIPGVAAAFGIPCVTVRERRPFADAFRTALDRSGATVIEVVSDRQANLEEHERIERAIAGVMGPRSG